MTGSKSVRQRSQPREWLESVLWAVAVALLLRAFVVQAFRIPSGSMEDTLQVGDFLFVNKFVYGAKLPFSDRAILPAIRPPRRGDIIVFKFPLDGRDFIKRCVALAGDTVQVRDRQLLVNGRRPDEPYAVHKAWDAVEIPGVVQRDVLRADYQRAWEERSFVSLPWVRDNFGPVVVPAGCVFAMGDNRDNSLDSRFWGPLPLPKVVGRAEVIYWSWDTDNGQPFWNVWRNLRWERLGRIIR